MKRIFAALPAVLSCCVAALAQDEAARNVFLGVPQINFPQPRGEVIEAPESAAAAPRLKAATTRCFYVIGTDAEAVGAAKDVALSCEGIFSEAFGAGFGFPSKIILNVITDGGAAFEGSVSASVDAHSVSISARWDESLPFDAFCRLVSGAMLRRVAAHFSGAQGAAEVPFWMEMAFSKSLELSETPTGLFNIARAAAKTNLDPLERVLSYSRRDSAQRGAAEINSYWTLRALSSVLGGRLPAFLRASLDGADARAQARGVASILSKEGLSFELLWRGALAGEIHSRMGGVLTPEDSRAEVLRCGVISIGEEDGSIISLEGEGVWRMRERPQVRSALRARIVEIDISRSMRVNPVYHDAILALGQSFECALEDDEGGFKKYRAEYLSACALAFSLEKRAAALLAAPLSKLVEMKDAALEQREPEVIPIAPESGASE